ncbi:hypothetical protein AB4Z52_25540 [Rhizobium sp. 2YAF20]|uniref:hypothetical protein n=1 Tax=Rhizobium sp. 2YAF20 TaxID=3233027 RepID=UPI003F99DDBE
MAWHGGGDTGEVDERQDSGTWGHGSQHRLDVMDIALPLPPVNTDPGVPTEDDAAERNLR